MPALSPAEALAKAQRRLAALLKRKRDLDAAQVEVAEKIRKQRRIVRRRRRRARGPRPAIVSPTLLFTYVWGTKGRLFRAAGHYSAGTRARNARELVALIKSFHAFHRSKGWGGVSYEYLIGDDGTLGLGNRVDRLSAAVALNNTGLINVCFPGTTGDRPTEAQQRTFNWLLDNAHTDALPKSHRAPVPLRALVWKGHKQFPGQGTLCPGEYLPLIVSEGKTR